jgi:hypothetical protein
MHSIRRQYAILSVLLAAPIAVSRADCKADTTTHKPATLFSRLRIAALHADEAASSATVNGESQPFGEFRLAVAFCNWPEYTLAAAGGGNVESIRTAYVEAGSSFHPELNLTVGGLELQRRWRNAEIFRPMVAVGTGSVTAEYHYTHRHLDGTWETYREGHSSASYVTASVGAEAMLFKYVSAYVLVGQRWVGELRTPELDAGAMRGQYAAFGIGFGKFR